LLFLADYHVSEVQTDLRSGGKKSASTSRASCVSAEPPKLASSGRRSGVDTSVTYNRRQMKADTTTNVSVDSDKTNGHGSATRRGRGNNREQRKLAAASAPVVETVKRKISSEWDDCMHSFST